MTKYWWTILLAQSHVELQDDPTSVYLDKGAKIEAGFLWIIIQEPFLISCKWVLYRKNKMVEVGNLFFGVSVVEVQRLKLDVLLVE